MRRAITQHTLGGPKVLTEVEVDRPKPGAVEVLVRVHAAGVNSADWEARANGWGGSVPRILGFDVSGVVEAVGFGVTLYRPVTRFSGCRTSRACRVATPST